MYLCFLLVFIDFVVVRSFVRGDKITSKCYLLNEIEYQMTLQLDANYISSYNVN